MRNRGLYGQSEGNERQGDQAAMAIQCSANELVEGQLVATLHRMMKEQNWKAIEAYYLDLRHKGHSQARIDSMICRAGVGIRL